MSSTSVGLADKQHQKELEYWLEKLSGEPVVTGVPLDFKRPPVIGAGPQKLDLCIDPETQNRLRKTCEGNELLIFTACVAALKVCLYRYTHVEDVIIGTAIHQQYRDLTPDNRIVVLRDRVTSGQTVRQLLEQVLQTITGAYAHQKYSFKRLLQHLRIAWPPNRAPLFNVVALLENINRREDASDLLNDVTVVFAVKDGELSGALEYSPELFKPETIAVFARHFESTLREMLGQPDAKIAELHLLSDARKQELVVEFNDTARDFPREQTVAQLFEAQAEQTPQSVAVVFEGKTLTYRELNQRANQLAHALRGLDVGPGTLLGVYLEHSLETMIALLGVLKTGAAYVPLDTQHPPSRTAFMLSNAGISILLTQESLVDRVADQVSYAICLDTDWENSIAGESTENPSPRTATPRSAVHPRAPSTSS